MCLIGKSYIYHKAIHSVYKTQYQNHKIALSDFLMSTSQDTLCTQQNPLTRKKWKKPQQDQGGIPLPERTDMQLMSCVTGPELSNLPCT